MNGVNGEGCSPKRSHADAEQDNKPEKKQKQEKDNYQEVMETITDNNKAVNNGSTVKVENIQDETKDKKYYSKPCISKTNESETKKLDDVGAELKKEGGGSQLEDVTEDPNGIEETQESNNDTEEEELELTEAQEAVVEYVKNLIENEEFRSKNKTAVIITGPAGTGKTTLLKTLSNVVRYELKLHVMCAASTGAAALNFTDGKTGHSMFGFPRTEKEKCRMNDDEDFRNSLSEELLRTSLITYDNVNMVNAKLIQMLNKFLQDLMNSQLPFGGKVIVFAANFLEVPPINFGSLCEAPLYRNLHPFRFETPIKVSEDYFNFLETIYNSGGTGMVSLSGISCTRNIENLIDFVFSTEVFDDPNLCSKRVILHPTNRGARAINEIIMNRVHRDDIIPYECIPIDVMDDDNNSGDDADHEEEDDEEIILPDTNLKVWKGCLCAIVKTVNHSDRLLVGAKVIVEKMGADEILVRRPNSNIIIPITRKKFKNGNNSFEQFPLRLAYATTIHKSQSLIFDRVGIDLRIDVFRHGQLYLALSRVNAREDVMVCLNTEAQKAYDIVTFAYNNKTI